MSLWSRLLTVRQHFPDRALSDVRKATRDTLTEGGFHQRLKPGSRIAIGVGSRGINNLPLIVRAVVDFWKDAQMKPFLFPAMGSHGAATAEGQAEVLNHFGINEQTMGCPVLSQLDVVSLGKTSEGIEAFMDKNAFESDGIMLVGRVKWHTDFAGKIESGLFKMMAIGVGKFAGAQRYHTYAYKLGLEHVIRHVGRQVLASGKILGGLAILEDANHSTAQVTAVPVGEMETREEELLAQVKSWMGRIPCDLDILIIDEIGKNFSGAGMDTKVVNRSVRGQYNLWDTAPRFERIYLRGISEHSYRNAVGLGMADLVHDKLLGEIDWNATQINSLTASTPAAIRTPIHFSSDKLCLEKISPTVGKLDVSEVTLGWIRNSLEINVLGMTENLRPMIEKDKTLEIIEGPAEWPFDGDGQLPRVLPVPDRISSAAHH